MKLGKKAERLLEYYVEHKGEHYTLGDLCAELKTTPKTFIKSNREIEVAIEASKEALELITEIDHKRVTCIHKQATFLDLTVGKDYKVLQENLFYGTCKIKDDAGKEEWYAKDNFKTSNSKVTEEN